VARWAIGGIARKHIGLLHRLLKSTAIGTSQKDSQVKTIKRLMEVSEAKERLLGGGWFATEAPTIQGETVTWTVACSRKEQRLLATGGNRLQAWDAAVSMAADFDSAK
jgi:hypothetical protein